MKKSFTLLFLSLIFIGCSKSPQEKAIDLVNKNLQRTLNDYNSYELVEFSELDSTFTTPLDNRQFVDSFTKHQALKQLSQEAQEKYESYTEYSSKYFTEKRIAELDKAIYFLNQTATTAAFIDSFRDTFKPKFNGWEAEHRFRANNAMGNKVLGIYKWHFNIAIDSIIDQKDLTK